MADSSRPIRSIRRDVVQLSAQATLRQLLAMRVDGSKDDPHVVSQLVVAPTEDGRYAVAPMQALWALAESLSTATEGSIADALLDAPLGELLAAIATVACDEWELTEPGPVDVHTLCVVVKDGQVVGVLGEPAVNSVDSLLAAIGVAPDRLNEPYLKAAPPALEEDDLLNLPSGGSGELSEFSGEEGAPSDRLAESADEVEEPKSLETPPTPAVTPPPVPIPSPSLVREAIRLDVATPETAVVNEAFDVAVAIRQPASPPLNVDDLTRLASTEGAIFRAPGVEIVRYRVEVEAKDCDVEPPSYMFLLERGKDSLVHYFQLTPRREGNISIVVNAYQADDGALAAATRVRLKAVVQVASSDLDTAVASASAATFLTSPALDLIVKLYDALRSEAFSLDDLQDLAFRLGVPWDELSGDTQSAKARSLVRYMQQRNALEKLREAIRAERPQLEV